MGEYFEVDDFSENPEVGQIWADLVESRIWENFQYFGDFKHFSHVDVYLLSALMAFTLVFNVHKKLKNLSTNNGTL